jgi:hypothetical protein
MSDDVKELLGRAFGEEPPLRIDRDEVLQQGRKRLRRRRFLEAGGVVAAVVVAVVGAATLTNLAGSEPDRLPPAASYPEPTRQEGPELPLPTPTTMPSVSSPSDGAETAPPGMIPAREVAAALTKALYDSKIVQAAKFGPLPGNSGQPLFEQYATQYVYEADVVREESQGYLHIAVDYAPGAVVSCESVPEPFTGCEIVKERAGLWSNAYYEGPDGERRVYVSVVLDSGFRLAATASNYTLRAREAGTQPNAKAQPVLSDDELAELLVGAGLGVS